MLIAPNQLKNLVLKQAEVVLGHLHVTTLDFPWVYCTFAPTPEFDSLRPLFETELRLSENEDWEALEKIDEDIAALRLELTDPTTGAQIRNFLIHFDVGTAWFRY